MILEFNFKSSLEEYKDDYFQDKLWIMKIIDFFYNIEAENEKILEELRGGEG